MIIVKRAICTNHSWYTPIDYGCSHGTDHAVTRYQVMHRGPDHPLTAHRANGDVIVYPTYSGAYSYLRRLGYTPLLKGV